MISKIINNRITTLLKNTIANSLYRSKSTSLWKKKVQNTCFEEFYVCGAVSIIFISPVLLFQSYVNNDSTKNNNDSDNGKYQIIVPHVNTNIYKSIKSLVKDYTIKYIKNKTIKYDDKKSILENINLYLEFRYLNMKDEYKNVILDNLDDLYNIDVFEGDIEKYNKYIAARYKFDYNKFCEEDIKCLQEFLPFTVSNYKIVEFINEFFETNKNNLRLYYDILNNINEYYSLIQKKTKSIYISDYELKQKGYCYNDEYIIAWSSDDYIPKNAKCGIVYNKKISIYSSYKFGTVPVLIKRTDITDKFMSFLVCKSFEISYNKFNMYNNLTGEQKDIITNTMSKYIEQNILSRYKK